MSRKKGAAVAIIAVVAAIGGIAAFSSTQVQDEGPERVMTTIERTDGPENESTTIAQDDREEPEQSGANVFANNTIIANNTLILNKPVYRNDTIIYQPITINLENYETTIKQHIEMQQPEAGSRDEPADTSHSITINAKRIQSEGWSARFTDDDVGMFAAVYDISGELVKTGYADERGFTVEGLENSLYFVYPADCNDCSKSKNDIVFRQWEDGSKGRPRLVPADSEVTASYRLVIPDKPRQVPLTPPPSQTETAADPEITVSAFNATHVYGWVQVTVGVKDKEEGFDEILIDVYAPNGSLHDSFTYSEQQGFFTPRDAGEGEYRIAATYEYGNGVADAEITHPVKFVIPEFANLSARDDNGTVRVDGMLSGGLAGENVTVDVHDPDGLPAGRYATSFGTRPVFTLFIEGQDIFNATGNYTFVVTHVQTGTQGNATLFHQADETETAASPVNVSENPGRSGNAALAVHEDNIYLVWEDDDSGRQEILFAMSDDSGDTFSEPVAISRLEEGGFARDPDIIASGDSVYVVWADYTSEEESAPAFAMSSDGGETFGNKTVLGDYLGEGANPTLALFGGQIYVSWISGAFEEFAGNLVLARSSNGSEFEAAIVSENAINAVMGSSEDMLYLSWAEHPSADTTEGGTNMFASSPDGTDFEVEERLEGMTVFSISASQDAVYVAGVVNTTVVVAKSTDGGLNFNTTEIENGFFAHVLAAGDKVDVAWEDDGILIASSTDGAEFGEPEKISDAGFWPRLAAGDGLYVAWTEDSDILLLPR